MKLRILGNIYFHDIRRSVPVGIPEGVSREFLFFAKETCNAARRDICFADIRSNPDYSEHSLLTPIDAMCMPTYEVPYVLIFIRQESCTETMALHELMHAYLYFAEAYSNPRALRGSLPFHVRLFGGLTGNIAMDLHTNERLKERGFAIDSLREEYFRALEGHMPLMTRRGYGDDVGMQWQIGTMWGHMLAGAQFYELTSRNRQVHRRLQRLCRKHSRGTIRFRDLLVHTCRRVGYDTPEKVGRIVEEITPILFKALGEPFKPEYIQPACRRSPVGAARQTDVGQDFIMRGGQA